MAFVSARQLHHSRRYRLLARPPLTVTFPSVIYRLTIEPMQHADQTHLWARSLAGAPNWSLTHGGRYLDREIYETGFELLHPTAASLILEALCADGRAERLTPSQATIPA